LLYYIYKNSAREKLMSGIIFFKTTNLTLIKEFYEGKLGLKIFKDQGKCVIFEHGNMRLGFCEGDTAENSGTITLVYPTRAEVDAAYRCHLDIASTKPELNSFFKIYHFWASDPEHRSLEFQCFVQPEEQQQAEEGIVVLNPDQSKPKLLLTRMIPDNAVDRLKQVFEVHANIADAGLTKAEIMAEIAPMDALLCLLTDAIDQEVITAGKRLKVISNYAVGYNNIDTDFAASRGIAVCNTPGVLTESTADLCWALIMATARRITEAEAYLRAGKFRGWEPLLLLGQDVHQRTLGILGMGRIGEAVARRAIGFGMRIIYHSRNAKKLDFAAEPVDLATLLKESDILSIHVPLSPDTRHLIAAAELALLKPDAILINTARGPVVDESALISALQEGRLFAAGFDVYENEPQLPEALLALPNVVLLPHIGSASLATRAAMGKLAAENAIAIVQGKAAPARVL
jgi:glyoxylate reductase